jgi:hypothetical protein
MKKHPFRWESLAFGLFFLSCAANWAVWKQDLLTPRELSLTASGVLILLGVLGVAATLWQARRSPVPSTQNPNQEGPHDEAADAQP